MNIQEAIRSEKPFKRKGTTLWVVCRETFTKKRKGTHLEIDEFLNMIPFVALENDTFLVAFQVDSILAEDWEIKEENLVEEL